MNEKEINYQNNYPNRINYNLDDIKDHRNKKRIILLVFTVIILLSIVGFSFVIYNMWNDYKKTQGIQVPPENNVNLNADSQIIIEESIKGVLPSISNNPLENEPDINPSENTNPIEDIKTNPFE